MTENEFGVEPPRVALELWLELERCAVPSDFWCYTHGGWIRRGCGSACFTVGVYMRDRDGQLPLLLAVADDEVEAVNE